MKIAGIACLLVLIGAWAYVHAQTNTKLSLSNGPVGRYQVVPFDFDETMMSGMLKHKSAIRVDTQTGQTWELVELPGKDGGHNLYWQAFNE